MPKQLDLAEENAALRHKLAATELQRDELAAALNSVVSAFSTIALKGHRTNYDWNADPERLTLLGSTIFEARYEPEKVLAARDRERDAALIGRLIADMRRWYETVHGWDKHGMAQYFCGWLELERNRVLKGEL